MCSRPPRRAGRRARRSGCCRARFASGPYPARNEHDNLADLEAQIAANRAGALRLLLELVARYGSATVVVAYMGHVQRQRGGARWRRRSPSCPTARTRFADAARRRCTDRVSHCASGSIERMRRLRRHGVQSRRQPERAARGHACRRRSSTCCARWSAERSRSTAAACGPSRSSHPAKARCSTRRRRSRGRRRQRRDVAARRRRPARRRSGSQRSEPGHDEQRDVR